MRKPSATELLATWERAAEQPAAKRALLLLSSASPDCEWEALTSLGIGERDMLLLELQQALFGGAMQCLVRCAHCAEQLEFGLDVKDVRANAGIGGRREQLELDGFKVSFRLPINADVLDLHAGQAVGEAERRLFARCVLAAYDEEGNVAADALPEPVKRAVTERMAELDPVADVRLELQCAACGARWPATFDIAAFLWDEVDAWASSALRDIHVLARAYGWSESDILGMSPLRRRAYLDMLDA